MNPKKVVLTLLAAFLFASSPYSLAQSGTFLNQTMVWDGITRYYQVYLPLNLPAQPQLLLMLHGTSTNKASNPPTQQNWGWLPLANQYKFILVKPASTYNAQSGQWNWNAYYLDGAFPPPAPDDSGFLRQLITNLTAQYGVDPKRVYVAGMSAGAMMAHRVGVELSDLVAAIVPASGQIVGQPTLPIVLPGPPLSPVSVQEWHGNNDPILQPCNNGSTKYSGYTVVMATVDQSFNYWAAENGCSQLQSTQPLCANGLPNPNIQQNDATGCANNAEVEFKWEGNIGHYWEPSNDLARWQFLSAHPKP
ncbi:MAG: alpha/beta hydrolase fold domain-containing protein [Acidobacteria bacterium]|nr:alpha/beta hydrolase fold domain-containing protein [Acidobacteriota bacterium]